MSSTSFIEKSHQEGNKQVSLYGLAIIEINSMTSKINKRSATLRYIKKVNLASY